MKKEEFKLWVKTPYFDEKIDQKETTLTFYKAPGNTPRGCVIVCPGGAYSMRADHEGNDIALMLNENGFSAFVLNYRVAPYHHPTELEDAKRAIRFVRFNAEKFGILPDKIGIMGFSAGGHLAISASEHFDYGRTDGDEIDKVSSRPDASIFCYAVSCLTNEFTHVGSRENLLGYKEIDETAEKLSGENSVRPDMPPVFIWHTFGDTCVPVENSLILAMALRKAKIPVEMHIFPDGPHGLGLAPAFPHTAKWAGLLCSWLEHIDF